MAIIKATPDRGWGAKLKVTGCPFMGKSTITIDGHEINGITALDLRFGSGNIPEATLYLALEEVEVDSEFLVYLQGHVSDE